MMKRLYAGIALVLLTLLTTMAAAAQNPYEPVFEPTDCPIFVRVGSVQMDCGFLVVPEDRNGDPEDTIRIAVAIYRSRSATPASDPVFFLHGGPADHMLEMVPYFYRLSFVHLTADRDLVVFDQRGVGLSEPALDCPEFSEIPLDEEIIGLTVEEVTKRSLDAISACRASLEADFGVNPAAYTTAASAMDIADLAHVLGYDTINLYGISYGTQLAQVVMRDNPDLVRAVALDGVMPLAINFVNEGSRSTALALDEIFTVCAASPSCSASYPDLEATFYDTVAALDENPQPLTITHPNTGEEIDIPVGGSEFIISIIMMLRNTEAISQIPRTIDRVANGQVSALAPLYRMQLQMSDAGSMSSDGAHLSIMCHEEIFATTPEQMEADLNAVPDLEIFDDSAIWNFDFQICEAWGAAPFDPLTREPVFGDIPTVLLGGQYDPTTPPEWNALVAQNLTNAYSYEIPGVGHIESLIGGCPMEIIVDFLNDPTTAPDADCIEGLGVEFISD